MTLVDLLTQPLQRLTRYPLLLRAISKQARTCGDQPAATLSVPRTLTDDEFQLSLLFL